MPFRRHGSHDRTSQTVDVPCGHGVTYAQFEDGAPVLIDRLQRWLHLRRTEKAIGREPEGATQATTDTSVSSPGPQPELTPQRGRHRSAPDSSNYDAIYEPLHQAVRDETSAVPAAAAAGRRLAERGIPLVDALDAMQSAYHKTNGEIPPFEAIRGLCQSWTDCALASLQAPSCEDPGTGLATTPHLRSRLNELYRKAEQGGWYLHDTHILVIAEPIPPTDPLGDGDAQLPQAADCLRIVFKEAEVVARLGLTRVAAVVRLDPQLTEQLSTLRSMLSYQPSDDGDGDGDDQETAPKPSTKIWTERLPTLAEWSDTFVSDLANG